MKKKEEIRQLDKLWAIMKKRIKAYLISGNQEDLHQFRVQVKKVKAMLTLYAFEAGNKELLKHFKPVKKIFQKAGEIRNAHINLNLGEKHQLDDESFNQQQQQILDNSSVQFKKKGSKHLKAIRKTHLILQNNINRLHDKTIRNFYREKLAQIEAFFDHITFDEELHNARKNIKLLMYNKQLAAKAIKGKVQVNQDYLDQLQNTIGKWHDHNLAIEMLAGIGEVEDQAISNIKASNATLEKTITELGNNFWEKVSAEEQELVESQQQQST